MKLLLAVRVVVPFPAWVKVPVPLIALPRVNASLRFTTSELLSTTLPLPRVPLVPPLPTPRVPAVMKVPPE